MSDPSPGAYTPGHLTTDSSPTIGDTPTGGGSSAARHAAQQGKEAAVQAAGDVKETAAEQAHRVGAEAKTQVRNVATEMRDKLGEHARAQSDRLVGSLRETSDHLDQMRGDRQDTPAAAVVSRVAEGGRQFADYLDRHGPEGVLQEVQDFARRRPGAFLATALAAGFVVGRLGKSVAKADPNAGTAGDGDGSPRDTFASDLPPARPSALATGYPAGADTAGGFVGSETAEPFGGYTAGGYTGTDYAATGTGEPLVVDDYAASGQEPRR